MLCAVQVSEEGGKAEGEEEQCLEAAARGTEAGTGQEAEEVCEHAMLSLSLCMTQYIDCFALELLSLRSCAC